MRYSYHGDTFGAMAASGKHEMNEPFWKYLFDIEMFDPPLEGHIEQSAAQLKAIIAKGEAACFIFEPLVLAVRGMIMYPPEGLDTLINICREAGVHTIADEVFTGFGRTGTVFACDQLSAKPDIVCVAKGMSGGYLPIGATACTQEIYDAFFSDNRTHALLHGHSYTANPLGCCSALASLDLLISKDCAEQREMIAANHRHFCEHWKGHPRVKRCTALGTILAIEYRTDGASYFNELRDRLYDYFREHGILVRPLGNVLSIIPPYCITEDELQYIYKHIQYTLEEIL